MNHPHEAGNLKRITKCSSVMLIDKLTDTLEKEKNCGIHFFVGSKQAADRHETIIYQAVGKWMRVKKWKSAVLLPKCTCSRNKLPGRLEQRRWVKNYPSLQIGRCSILWSDRLIHEKCSGNFSWTSQPDLQGKVFFLSPKYPHKTTFLVMFLTWIEVPGRLQLLNSLRTNWS